MDLRSSAPLKLALALAGGLFLAAPSYAATQFNSPMGGSGFDAGSVPSASVGYYAADGSQMAYGGDQEFEWQSICPLREGQAGGYGSQPSIACGNWPGA